ncbi:hypothetical protein CS022_01385 [Veronia nyctiphanis]|uniref:HTH araC/xylS-type domain-containing protein n=1 Tax=Veronia nyctiphanis TaxID=1278244 RepID=A0A4Q0Z0F2_9GAMM|nr:AraC family transcriptional regulator [Veronia nyctiphanis]RXJ74881.1 hypothetical protein CS022_01385 [Veronia nyctiphanis]
MQLYSDRLQPSIHPAYARIICAYFAREGMDAETFLNPTNINWDDLQNDTQFISFEQFSRIASRSVQVSQKPWIALELAKTIQTGHHSSLGFGVVVSKNLKQAIEFITTFMGTRQKIFSPEMTEEPGGLKITMVPNVTLLHDEEFVCCALFGVLYRAVVTITGLPIKNWLLSMTYEKPDWAVEYDASMPGNQFLFGQKNISVFIPNEYLNVISLTHEPGAFQLATSQCERIKKQQEMGEDIALRVRCLLLNSESNFMGLNEVADNLSMSTRTLMRKLKASETSYQEILDDVRKEFAIWYLTKTSMTVEEISDSLGYQEASNFSRTFKRWVAKRRRSLEVS